VSQVYQSYLIAKDSIQKNENEDDFIVSKDADLATLEQSYN